MKIQSQDALVGLSHVPAPENPLDIVIYHIGGEGGYGPIEKVLKTFTNNCMLVIFEARSDTSDLVRKKELGQSNIPVFIVNKCVSERAGKTSFRINKFPLSSSIFPPSPQAVNEHVVYEHCHTWGENTELSSLVEMDTVSIDQIVGAGIAPPPDVLSIDAQGAEYLIWKGAKNTLREYALCVVSEVEFFEIYADQGLLNDQMEILGSLGFRLVDILNTQYWHPAAASGKGFLTVGEAVFFRLLENILEEKNEHLGTFHKIVKLAGIASAFSRLSYCLKIFTHLEKYYPEHFYKLKDHDKYRELDSFYKFTQKDMHKYEMNNRYFLNVMNNCDFSSNRWDFSGRRTKPRNAFWYKVTICSVVGLIKIIRSVVGERGYAKIKKMVKSNRTLNKWSEVFSISS